MSFFFSIYWHCNILMFFSIDPAELQECCQSALQSFNLCMFYEPVVYAEEENRDENLQYLDDDLVFKLVVICMSTIHLLQIRGMSTIRRITADVAELQIDFLSSNFHCWVVFFSLGHLSNLCLNWYSKIGDFNYLGQSTVYISVRVQSLWYM